jgi:hypothetical protein
MFSVHAINSLQSSSTAVLQRTSSGGCFESNLPKHQITTSVTYEIDSHRGIGVKYIKSVGVRGYIVLF